MLSQPTKKKEEPWRKKREGCTEPEGVCTYSLIGYASTSVSLPLFSFMFSNLSLHFSYSANENKHPSPPPASYSFCSFFFCNVSLFSPSSKEHFESIRTSHILFRARIKGALTSRLVRQSFANFPSFHCKWMLSCGVCVHGGSSSSHRNAAALSVSLS